jgi:virginiamycin B lyase
LLQVYVDVGLIVRITPAGVITNFLLPAGDGSPGGLTVGPDGNLWFPENGDPGQTGRIGRITPTGVITDFALPTAGIRSGALTVGPDGNLWFPENFPTLLIPPGYPLAGPGRIGRITPSGTITEFPFPASAGFLGNLTVGSDGNLWFTEGYQYAGTIGRITPSGVATEFPLLERIASGLGDLTLGSDGNLWFIADIGRIDRITP